MVSLVADNFAKLVMEQKEKDVQIEFYSPTCTRCKDFEPVYTKLAKKLKKSHPHLMVAKMDATANDVLPKFVQLMTEFPSIFFIPAVDKEKVIDFKGQLKEADVASFVFQQTRKVEEGKTMGAEFSRSHEEL